MSERFVRSSLVHGGGLAFAVLGFVAPVRAAQDGVPVSAGAVVTSSRPSDPLAEAKASFDAAAVAADRGDYAAALALMQKAYELSRHPWLLFNLGSIYEKLGECRAAIAAFEAYVAAVPNGKKLAQARASIAALEPTCAETSESARIVLAKSVEPASTPAVSPAPKRVPHSAAMAKPSPAPKVESDEQPARWRGEKAVGTAALVGGGLAAGVAVYFAWSAKEHADSMDEATAHSLSLPDAERPTWSATMGSMQRARDEDRTRALIFSGVSAILLGSGLVLLFFPGREPDDASPGAVTTRSRLELGIGRGDTIVGAWSTVF